MAGKHHVVQDATVQCQFSVEPKTDVLKVKTQEILTLNDKEGNKKFAATNKEIGQTLEKNSFGKCIKQPNGSGDFLPCNPNITEWIDFQELGSVGENKAKLLLEDSKATCTFGCPGCIFIKNHGQTGEGNQEQVKKGDNDVQNNSNPMFKDFVEEQTQAKAEPENMGPDQKREIVKVVMEDINGKPIPKGEKFFYGKVVNSVAHTTGMVGELLHFEMWEDDAIGAGHSDENRYNKVAEQFVNVGENGVAEVRFVISRTFSKIATAHNAYEGKTHEYYIIAYANETPVLASGNINIYAPEYKEEKKKVIIDKIKGISPVGVQEPKQIIKAEAPKVIIPKVPRVPGTKRVPTPKPVVPKAGEPKKITHIFFTDVKDRKINNAKYGDTIRAHIGSTGLIDYKVKIKAYDHEVMGENHFLGEVGNYTITANQCHVDIVLTKEMKEHGANLFSDEVYVDIEIMETKAHVVSTQIKVDTNNSIIDIARNITKSKYEKTDAEKKDDKKGECFCNRDITPDELKDMIVAMRKATSDESGENYYKWNKDNLFTSGHEKFKDKSYDKFSEVLNKTFTKYEINTCIRKIHFIAQCYEETGSFMRSVEGDTKTTYSYDPFRGRGFIQLTHREGYKSFQDVSGYEVIDNPKLVSTDIEIAAMSSGWYWRDNTNKNGNINNWADNDDVWNVSRLVNHPTATKAKGKINGLQNRIDATNSLKKIFKYPQKCITKKDVKETDCKEDCICKSEVLVTDGFFINPKISIDRVLVLEQDKFTDPLKLDGIILHRTVTKTTSSTISAFKAGRKNKKGKVIYYGTHFIVGKDGVITQTANLNYKTNHCTGWNSKSVGIEVVGMPVDIDGNSTVKDSEIVTWETLTDEQNKSVVCLLKLLLKHYGLSKSNLHCHENEAPKTAGEGKVVLDSITPYL